MNNYLIPMWSRKNNRTQNHLALIQAENRYQAMLIAIGSHGNMDGNGDIISEGFYTDWHIDMNYNAYREYKNPDEIFTYMNRYDKIESSTNEEENNHMTYFK